MINNGNRKRFVKNFLKQTRKNPSRMTGSLLLVEKDWSLYRLLVDCYGEHRSIWKNTMHELRKFLLHPGDLIRSVLAPLPELWGGSQVGCFAVRGSTGKYGGRFLSLKVVFPVREGKFPVEGGAE
jgi:hypothetical protein